jgi:hypothetical protein
MLLLLFVCGNSFSAELEITDNFRHISDDINSRANGKKKATQTVYNVKVKKYSAENLGKCAKFLNFDSKKGFKDDSTVCHIESESSNKKLGFLKNDGTLFYFNRECTKDAILPEDVEHIKNTAKSTLGEVLGDNMANYEIDQVRSRYVMLPDAQSPDIICKTYSLKRVIDGRTIRGPIGYATVSISKKDEVTFLEMNDPEIEPVRDIEWKGMKHIENKLTKRLSGKQFTTESKKKIAQIKVNDAKLSYVYNKEKGVLIPSVTVTTENITDDGKNEQELIDIECE